MIATGDSSDGGRWQVRQTERRNVIATGDSSDGGGRWRVTQTERRNVIATGDSSDWGGGGDGGSRKRKDGT